MDEFDVPPQTWTSGGGAYVIIGPELQMILVL